MLKHMNILDMDYMNMETHAHVGRHDMMEGLHEHRHAWSHILLKKQIRNKTIKTEAQTDFSIALSPGGETKKQDKKGKTCTC